MKHTLIHLNDPNLRCSLTLVLVRQKGQSSLVVIARGGTMRSMYGRSVIFLHIAILASMTQKVLPPLLSKRVDKMHPWRKGVKELHDLGQKKGPALHVAEKWMLMLRSKRQNGKNVN